ncbi:hypothetical protein Agub_g2796, partial [Astrephomene gubernaculifera]
DAVHFLRPCRLGCVVIIAAMVSRTFTTSLEVSVVVESEDMRTGVRHHCCSAHLTFVVRPRNGATVTSIAASTTATTAAGRSALPPAPVTTSASGDPAPESAGVTVASSSSGSSSSGRPLIPRVYPTTPEHQAMWEGAEVRRQQRLERRTRVRRSPELQAAERVCRLQPITHREGGAILPHAVTLSRPPAGAAVAFPAAVITAKPPNGPPIAAAESNTT